MLEGALRVLIVHDVVGEDSAPDVVDALVQRDSVTVALRDRGHEVASAPVDLDLGALRRHVESFRPDVVFNLVESLEESGRLIHLPCAVLDVLGTPYTGCPTEAVFLTSHKALAKERLRAAGLPTPAWWTLASDGAGLRPGGDSPDPDPADRVIVKSIWEDASFGLDDAAIVAGLDREGLARCLAERAPRLGGLCLAEAFVDGREFNLSVLDGPGGPTVLPPAEIDFRDFPPGKPRIVGYQAKWDEASFEYVHTDRRLDFGPADAPLLARLGRLALDCWRAFDLAGYARVDFRVDGSGRPWVLEVNSNPCLSPDAGFAAAVGRAGLAYAEAIDRIVGAALRGTVRSGI